MQHTLKAFLFLLLIALCASCSTKKEEETVATATETATAPADSTSFTDSVSTSPSTGIPPMNGLPPMTSLPPVTGPSRDGNGPRRSGDTISAIELAPGEKMPYADRTVPIGEAPLIAADKLAQLHPVPPNYIVDKSNNKDLPTVHRSVALLRNRTDTSKTIRSSIFDQNEKTSYMLIQQISDLRTKGSVTQYVDGQPVTAYYVNVNGAGGSKAYIASKHVATVTLLLSDHTLLQLREDNVSSADHLMEVAKLIDTKKFDRFQREAR